MNAPKTICCNYMQPHACADGHPNPLLTFLTFDSESGSCDSESGGRHGPHRGEACFATCVGPQWPEWANTCLGLLLACVGTRPCTWLHRASLFWHANSFWLPLERFLRTLPFWRFFAVFGQLACQTTCPVAPKGGWS